MKVVVFAGGTGSAQIQIGFKELFGDKLDYSIITNLADNGLSTGDCRKVMGGNMMGPSDLRKNQLHIHKLRHGTTPLWKFLDKRVTGNKETFKEFLLDGVQYFEKEVQSLIKYAVEYFFAQPAASELNYDDFSVSNVIYTGLAGLNGNSLSKAGQIMENILNIPVDSVVPVGDKSLYLMARTESGVTITDEGDIVKWNSEDKIHYAFYVDNEGHYATPFADERALRIIGEADIILFSSGTLWSSLIPTYLYTGVGDAIANSKAKKYLLMNATSDNDVIGVTGDKVIEILSNYLPVDEITILQSEESKGTLLEVTKYNVLWMTNSISDFNPKVHDGHRVVAYMFRDFYLPYAYDTIGFDYDDTLVDRKTKDHSNVSLLKELKSHFNLFICSGNTHRSFVPRSELKGIRIFAENGLNEYEWHEDRYFKFVKCLKEEFKLTNIGVSNIIEDLTGIGFPSSKISNRNNASVAIKPVHEEYRKILANILGDIFYDFKVITSGNTTIEIFNRGINKTIVIEEYPSKSITFVGDENYPGGNDYEIARHPAVKFLQVRNANDTYIFLRTLVLLNRTDYWNE
jgi:2-phospho-L-lactate transferase/gluconeogenesis factor (CofD/UPF0052 family)